MDLEQAEKIVELIVEDGGEASVYPNYSGRGMYGRTVVGITVSRGEDLGFYAAKAGLKKRDLPSRTDSMGKDLIYY